MMEPYLTHMVRKAGQEDGIGVWDVDGHSQISTQILMELETIDPEFIVDSVYVFGSFGSGKGVPGESDLDIIVSGYFNGVFSENELEVLQSEIASELESIGLVDEFEEFNGVDIAVNDPAYTEEILHVYQAFEPVDMYYDLINERKIEY